MLLAFFVDDLKIEEVEFDTPPYTTTSGIGFRINCLQVEQRAVVRHDIEGRMTQVVGVCPDGSEDPKEFSIVSRVVLLGVGQFFGAVGDDTLFAVQHLREDVAHRVRKHRT